MGSFQSSAVSQLKIDLEKTLKTFNEHIKLMQHILIYGVNWVAMDEKKRSDISKSNAILRTFIEETSKSNRS